MTVRSFPFFGSDSAEDDYYRLHRESGVISGLDLTLNGLGWSLSTGEAKAGGSTMLVETSPATGSSVATSAANPRRDMLVARRTLLPDGGSNTVPVLIEGDLAPSPVDPTPDLETVGIFEEPLFSWQVPGSGGTAVTGVRDLRKFLQPDAVSLKPISVDRVSGVNGAAINAGVTTALSGNGLTLPPLRPGHLVVVELSTDFYVEGAGPQNLAAALVPVGATLVAGHAGREISVSSLIATVHTRQTFTITSSDRVTFGSSYTAGPGAQRCILQRETWTAWL